MSKHLNNQDLLDRLYGIGRDDDHIEHCEDCRHRWMQMQSRRREVTAPPEVSAEFLAAQRRRIHERLESGRGRFWAHRLTPALAALSVVVLGVMLSRPTPGPPPTMALNGNGDSQFFTEIYAMVDSPGPVAADPIYGLFED